MYNFILPFKPVSVNAMWRKSRWGVIYLTQGGRQFKEKVKAEIAEQLGEVKILTGKIEVEVDIYFASHPQDLDNCLKVLLDAMQGIIYNNDRQIVKIVARKKMDNENAIIVTVCEE